MKSLEYYYKLDKSNYFPDIYKKHFKFNFKSMKFIENRNLENANKASIIKELTLPKKCFYYGKGTLIFDMDETLIHSKLNDLGEHLINFVLPNGITMTVNFKFKIFFLK